VFCQVIVDIIHENVAKPFTYAIPEGMTLSPGQRVAVPFGPRTLEGVVTEITERTEIEPAKVRKVLYPLEEYAAIPPELMALAEEMAARSHCPLAETLRLMIPAEMRGGRVRVKKQKVAWLAVDRETAQRQIQESSREGKRERLLRLLMDGERHPLSELSAKVRDPREVLKKMKAEGLVELEDEEWLRFPETMSPDQEDPGYDLTAGQQEALEEIVPALRKGTGRFLIHGVTGSGKTEVFMVAVKETLALGKGAIILVPEISLTPQMVSWFRGRFGPVAAVIHSRLSAGERYDEWRRIRRGEARVVIGARSAVFAPVRNLGLIVVDEEHETTYLNDRHPRYDAREVALSRCRREGGVLILASATPSILSFAQARRGDMTLLEMPSRVHGLPLPEVQLVDMRQELESGNRSIISRELRRELQECVRRGEQAMLLMNRRGYHSFVSCRSCGYVVKCPQCDLSLTYHLGNAEGMLRCHYCGYVTPSPARCPACGSKAIKYFGSGTQKVEEETRRILPGVATARMDFDTTSEKGGHERILEAFRSGKARVLIGTQMIAKGLDFPRVTLVGVIAADLTLNLPDYRSRERTFQLLTQVAGRAGRGERPGQVIIQTYRPDDPVIGFASRQDYRAFFEAEFQRRRKGLYPPFTILARILIESPREEAVFQTARHLEGSVRELLAAHPEWQKKVLMLLNDEPGVKILRGKHRRHLLMKLLTGAETEAFLGALTALREAEESEAETYLEVNPTTML